MSNGNGGYTNWSFIFQGYQNYGNASATNLFQIEFSNQGSFENLYHKVYPNHEEIYFNIVR